jgi:mRNA export factor
MAFLGTTGSTLDDYKNDVKPDQSMPAYADSVSSLAWSSPNIGNFFATTSWDGELRILSVEQGQYGPAIFQKLSYKFPFPALKCTWNDQGSQIYVGLMDGSIKVFDLGSSQTADVGRHNAAISSLHFVPGMNAIVSTGYESTAQIWQLGTPNPVMSINADNKIFCSDFQFPTLVAGTANERILVVDINANNSRTLVDSNDLGKFSQIQSIAINQKCSTFGIASFDGRANISSINKNVNGLYAPVISVLFRNRLSHSRATSRRRAETPFSIPLTTFPLILSTTAGL